jgi:S-DNA-T family DNA segregation ATPase FtsK/SpoIIIE
VARKEQPGGGAGRGWGDVLGIVLLALSLLLFVALFSYDKADLAINRVPPNPVPHNRIGLFGARMADGCFKWCGAAAYLLPVLTLVFGVGCFVSAWRYLQRRWIWGLLLLLTCAGVLHLYTDEAILDRLGRNLPAPEAGFLEQMAFNIGAHSAGGVLGLWLNEYLFGYFGTAGSTILFIALWLICLYGLTNFHLGDWLRAWWLKRAELAGARAEEKSMEDRARALEKEAKRLQVELARVSKGEEQLEPDAKTGEQPAGKPGELAGLGPDLKPVPEPTVRDLSVPQLQTPPPKPAPEKPPAEKPRITVSDPEPGAPGAPAPELELVIPARELRAATTAEVLGASEPRPAEPGPEAAPGENTGPVPPPQKPKPAPARKPKPLAVAATPQIGNYQLPPLDLLHLPDLTLKPTESKEELMANARLMQQTLAQFDIEVALGDITKGPTITRYELHPAPGVKLEKITALTNNIAAALKAERIHILAPVPGKSSVGVEVPNIVKSKVILRELLESEEWRQAKARIPLALGKDVYGHPIVADLAEMPHLLIAGSTGSGKSVCINAIVASLLYKYPPDQLRFVMIDPKVVELQQYNALPHLVVPVVTDPKKVILALRWVVNEMEKRYQIFARVGVRNIRAFNDRPKDKPLPRREPELPLTAKREKVEAGADGFAVEVDEEIVVPREEDILIPEKLSYIVVIIDELADLMLVAPADVEMAIARITQMARAAGIHCIVATQRPSVDVITGVIKANIPCRIAFQVAAKVDSRTILDAMGADKLLGKGDMLYLPPGSAKLIRAQGALVTDPEIQGIVDFIAKQGKPSYEMEIHQQLSKTTGGLDDDEGIDEDEDIIQQCIEVIRSEQKASVSLLQRRLRLGYTRAARIMDELENRGIVGPSKGAEPRDILIDLDGGGADGAGEGLGPAS